MALKFGKCPNPICHLCNRTQDADESNFVCGNPKCGTPLFEVRTKPPSYRNKNGVYIGSAILIVVLSAVAYLLVDRLTKQTEQKIVPEQITKSSDDILAKKKMEEWISELSDPSLPTPKSSDSDSYKRIWSIVNGLKSRASAIQALKQNGKVTGSEHGILNPLAGAALSDEEKNLLIQENKERRGLFAFIAEHSDPIMNYERVANEYAKNQWKEWPQR